MRHAEKIRTSPRPRRNTSDSSEGAPRINPVDELSLALDNLDDPEADTEAEAQLTAVGADGSRNPRKRKRASPGTNELCTLSDIYDINEFDPVISVEEEESADSSLSPYSRAMASTPSPEREKAELKDAI